jgi:hypothetical protein
VAHPSGRALTKVAGERPSAHSENAGEGTASQDGVFLSGKRAVPAMAFLRAADHEARMPAPLARCLNIRQRTPWQ